MKKIICTLMILLSFIKVFPQVGVGTTNPQEELHISKPGDEANANIRIDGLGNSNPLNNGVENVVTADRNGTLRLRNASSSILLEIEMYNTLAFVNTPSGTPTTNTVFSTTFTLEYPRLVNINYTLPIGFFNDTSANPIVDGRVRLARSSLVVDGITQHRSSTFYSNGPNNIGQSLFGLASLNGNRFLFLSAGTHTIRIDLLAGGGSSPTAVRREIGLPNYIQVVQF